MKIIKISDELYDRLNREKGEDSFSRYIEKLASPLLPPQPIPIVNGEVDYDLHEECCIEFIASGARKICEHWKPHRTPWGELQFVHEITGKKSNEYEEDGTWSPY